MTDGFVLETERLRLRRYTLDDLDDVAAMLGDDEHMRYYPAPFTRPQARGWIEWQLRLYGERGFGLWALELKRTGEFAGNCGPTIQMVDDIEEVELGWHIKRPLWGQGLAPEAAAACRDHCFDDFGIERLIALCRPVNVPSRRVAEKIGMHPWKGNMHGGFHHYVYAMAAGDPRPHWG